MAMTICIITRGIQTHRRVLSPKSRNSFDRLGITDVDSSVAAELILFFNPEIGLSGYGSSTYNSASAAEGLWNREGRGLEAGAVIDYSIWIGLASPITEDTDAAIDPFANREILSSRRVLSDSILVRQIMTLRSIRTTSGCSELI